MATTIQEAKRMKNDLFYRHLDIEERTKDGERSIRLSFSSEVDVPRWFGTEILSHKPGAMRKGRLGTLLFAHNRERIVGPLSNVRVEGGRGYATAGFDETDDGTLALARVNSGSLRTTSVGYQVHKFRKLMPDEEYQLASRTVKGGPENNPTYIAEDWTPIEVSLEPTPADPSVGIGRCATRSLDGIEIEVPQHTEKEPESRTGGNETMDEKELQKRVDEALAKQTEAGRATMKKVFDRAAAAGQEGLAFRMYSEGKTEDEITDAIIAAQAKERGKPGDAGEPEKETRSLDKIDDDTLVRGLTNPDLMVIN
jgi:hypothetical protein